jgi:hypothetical protein
MLATTTTWPMELDEDHGWQTVKGKNRSGNRFSHFKPDIATARHFSKDNITTSTTFFFTNFPERYGAKAVFNAFDNLGEVMEVVIPAKRDKGGRRFGFVRFVQVSDIQKLESDLDNMVFGGVKISVNLSRFQRSEGGEEESDRNGRSRSKHQHLRARMQHRSRSKSIAWNHRSCSHGPRDNRLSSYAQAVRTGAGLIRGSHQHQQKLILSYEVEKNAMTNHEKAFVGVVVNPGMTYNIQNAFHSQGYFGVKVTPLGSNLALLEGQEEGEVEALMVDAKDWLEQWFKEIRPWNPKDIDTERLVWLRVFGIPIHAWCDDFFAQVTRPWGCFLNADDVTSKKLTMDAARLLIRTSYQKLVDEFIDVKINGEIFHLRVLEDSYGPMRIVISQPKNPDGRDNASVCSEDESEERRLSVEEPESERESEGEGENLLAFNHIVNNNNEHLIIVDQVANSNFELEGSKANSMASINVLNVDSLEVKGGGSVEIGGVIKKGRWVEFGGKGLGQEVGVGGPELYTNSDLSVKGGGGRRETKSDIVGLLNKPNTNSEGSSGGKGGLKGGVYSDGPRGVYNFLNHGQKHVNQANLIPASVQKRKAKLPSCPPSASLRRQQHMARSLSNRKILPSHSESISSFSSLPSSGGVNHNPTAEQGVTRGPIRQRSAKGTLRAESISSAGEILCCSSLNSSDIRNCNNNILKNFEHEVVSKVWKGAVELGVELTACGSKGEVEIGAIGGLEKVCLKEIQENEKRDKEESIRREQSKNSHL